MSEISSQEDRVRYLRERGIEIEFPSDRKKPTNESGDNSASVAKRFVKIVKIPHNDSLPYEELSIPIETNAVGDQLPSLLRVFFNQGSVSVEDVKKAASASHQQQLANQNVTVTQDTIDKLSDIGSVEVFPLSHPNDQNRNTKVSYYLDEVGQLKKLSANRRASQFAELCGYQNVPLVGDIFVGRVGPDDDKPSGGAATNQDFSISELSSDAAWLKNVAQQNYDRGVATNQVAMESDLAAREEASKEKQLEGVMGLKWSESEEYIEAVVQLPAEIQTFTKKDILVTLQPQQIKVAIRNTTSQPLLDTPCREMISLWDTAKGGSSLVGVISVEDSTWCINDHAIELSLEKSSSHQGKWRHLVKDGASKA